MGVETNTYQIPDLVLSDTFYEWFTTTNNEIIEKLNLLKIYDVGSVTISGQGSVAGDGISAGVDSSGSLFIEIGSTIDKDITFNGNITVNGSTTTINSTNFSVDDYNIVLGATTENVSDEDIMNYSGNSAGGGMIILGSSGDKEFLWKYSNSAWNTNQNIALENESSIVGSSGIRIATGASGGTATKGLLFGFTAGTTGGVTGSDVRIQTFNSDLAAGYSADAIYINDDGYVSIVNGANKITVDQTGHGFVFGNVVYVLSDGTYAKAIADSLVASEVVGVVSRVYTADRFELTTQGEIVGDFTSVTDESSTLTSGAAYFLSPSSAGNITGEKPVDNGQIQKTVLIGLGSDRALVKNYIGGEVSIINQTAQALTSNKIIVLQEGHGFTYGDAAYIAPTGKFERAKAIPSEDNENYNDVVGIVEEVNLSGNEDAFSLVMSGRFQLAGGDGLVAGKVYYLQSSLDNQPNTTSDPPTSIGLVNKPVFVAESENTGVVTILRGQINSADEETDVITDVPIGAIIAYHGDETNIPDGYLLCDGQSVLIDDYPDLFSKLTATSVVNNDGNNFNVPDLSGRFIVGLGGVDRDGNPYALANQGGLNEVTLTVDEIPSHHHGVGRTNTQDTSATGTGFDQSPDNSILTNTTATGGGQAHENRPPYYALAWIIRARGVNPLADGTQILGGDTEFIQLDSYNDTTTYRISSTSNTSQTFTIDLVDMKGVGAIVRPELVRNIRLRFSSSVSASRGLVYVVLPSGNEMLVHQFKNGQSLTTDASIPVNPGQSSISFRLQLTDFPTVNTDTDSVTAVVYGLDQVVDNSLTRERRSYTHRKNLLINGNFDLWQRGVALEGSPDTSTDNVYTADRWIRSMNLSDITGTPSIEQKSFSSFQATIPHYPKYYIETSLPSSYGFPTDGHYCLEQRIEDPRTLANKNMTISFWARSTSEGQVFLGYNRKFQAQTDHFSVGVFTVGTTWRRYSFTVPVGSIPTSRIESADSYFAVAFYLACKSNIRANTGSDFTSSVGTLSIAQVQVEQGARATEFEIRSPGEELELSERFYWKDEDMAVSSAQTIFYPQSMRATPTITITSGSGTVSSSGIRSAVISNSATGFEADAEL